MAAATRPAHQFTHTPINTPQRAMSNPPPLLGNGMQVCPATIHLAPHLRQQHIPRVAVQRSHQEHAAAAVGHPKACRPGGWGGHTRRDAECNLLQSVCAFTPATESVYKTAHASVGRGGPPAELTTR